MKRIFLLFMLIACVNINAEGDYKTIDEEYITYWNENDNIDSPAFWQSKDGKQNIIIATSKNKHNLFIYDAINGQIINKIGKEGYLKGEFLRPNGIWVIDDYLFVCERDNHRIQVLSLPNFESIGFLGDNILKRPYGLSIYKQNNEFIMFVTDQYENEDGSYNELKTLNERVKKFSFTINNNVIKWNHLKSFGDTQGRGILFIVESIYADPINNNVLIAEEDKNQNIHKIYDLEGKFKNLEIGDDLFNYQAEGIALYDCGNGNGYWFCMDQDYYLTKKNTVHIFDRKTLKYITSFITGKTENTDGVWLTQTPFGNFKKGAFFAVHNDGGVGVFDLEKIMNELNLECK